MRGFRIGVLLGVLALIAGGVGAIKARGSDTRASAATVKVAESEMKVVSSAKQVPAGKVTFIVRNTGSVVHELVILRADVSLKGVPVVGFKAQEDEVGEVIDEAEDLEPGTSTRLTVNLKPGKYILLCNIVGHYQLGMRTSLRVT